MRAALALYVALGAGAAQAGEVEVRTPPRLSACVTFAAGPGDTPGRATLLATVVDHPGHCGCTSKRMALRDDAGAVVGGFVLEPDVAAQTFPLAPAAGVVAVDCAVD